MNRIRRVGAIYQVLITPSIDSTNSPDNSLLVGDWSEANFKNFSILEYPSQSQALCEALNHPNIDWFRLVLNHKHIYTRLLDNIRDILEKHDVSDKIQFISKLLTPEELKQSMFEVAAGNPPSSKYYSNNINIISFTLVNPWTMNLKKFSKILEAQREYYNRNDLRLSGKRIVDGKIILLRGMTEFGTSYEIRLIPSLIYQFIVWDDNTENTSSNYKENAYRSSIKNQDKIDLDTSSILMI